MVDAVGDSEFIAFNNRIYHLGLSPDQIQRNIFLVGDPDRVDEVSRYFDRVDFRVQHREFKTHTGTYRSMPASVVGTGIGTDNMEIALVELYGLNEFNLQTKIRNENKKPLNLIRLGTCGGLQKNMNPGSLVISQYALGLDNTGLFYDKDNDDDKCLEIEHEAYNLLAEIIPRGKRFRGRIFPYASKASELVVKSLEKSAKNLGFDYRSGITASAPGFFGCQGRKISGLKLTVPELQEHLSKIHIGGSKIVNMEMESSLLFHLAGQMNYRAGTICAVLANRPDKTVASGSEMIRAIDNCIKTGLEAMFDICTRE